MSLLATDIAYGVYSDLDGSPLDGGTVYFGVENQNPETNPITVYWDTAGTQPVAQPVLTRNGFTVRSGAIGNIYCGSAYSMTVRNKQGQLVGYWPSSTTWSLSTAVAALISSLATPTGSGNVGFVQSGTGAISRTVLSKGRDYVTSLDFGAKHDGVTDDTAAHQAGITYCQSSGKEYRVMGGASMVSGLTISGNVRIRGEGSLSILRQVVIAATSTFAITGSGTTVDISDLAFDGQQASQVALSTNDAINVTATGVSGGKPFELSVTNCDFLNTPYRGVAIYGANDTTKRTLARITGNRFRNGSVGDTNTVYSAIDVHLINGVEAIVDDNDFWFDAPPTLPGGRSAVVVAQTQTTTAYYTTPTITNNRINYRGVNELASLGAIDLYIWAGNAIVAHNTIKNSTASAIKFKANSYDVSVFDNKIDGQYSTGGALTTYSAITYSNPNYGSSASQVLIDDNQITNWNAGTGGVISGSAYDGSAFAKNVSITRNQMAAVTGIGIDIANCQDLTVSDNDIDGRSTVTIGIRALQCDGNIRIAKNKVANPTSYHIYNDTPLTATQDVIVDDNTLLGANGTYSIYVHCRQAIVRKNVVSGGFHGVNFGGGVQSAIMDTNILANMTGTVGFAVTSTAVNVIARDNTIVDSPTITTSAFANSASPTLLINQGNTWNGQVTQGSAAPSSGTWAVGDWCRNTAPTATGQLGWVCTTAGSPGTWTPVTLP